ncbi:hypothetical protein EC988_003733 [Linderina pennispora]|nr:hypothetical protein EC988_003733 [Linderina pennispora]
MFKSSFMAVGLQLDREPVKPVLTSEDIASIATRFRLKAKQMVMPFDESQRLFVIRGLVAAYWKPLVQVAIEQAALGMCDVWQTVALAEIFSLATGVNSSNDSNSQPSISTFIFEKVTVLMFMRVLHIHHSAFRQRVKVQVGNALHLAVCRRSILETGSTHTLQSLLDGRKVLLDAYVDSIFLLLNKLGPIIRLIGDITLTYSVVGWRIVVLFGTILALTAVSEAISAVYKQRRLDRRRPRTLHTRITEMLPSILTIKLNSWESAFLSLLPGDNYDDRGTGFLKVLAAAVRRMTKEAAVLLALSVFPIPAVRLSNADIIRLIIGLFKGGFGKRGRWLQLKYLGTRKEGREW